MTTAAAAALAVLLLLAAAAAVSPAAALGSAATLAVVSSTGAVCGISAGESPQSIVCLPRLAGVALPLPPNISFSAVSGGGDFLCGLAYVGTDSVVFCWNASYGLHRLHRAPGVLTGLSVGVDHVCAIDNATGATPCWRGGRRFPVSGPGGLRSVTSGRSFSCGIMSNTSQVHCWGLSPTADELERAYSNYSMSTLVAGDSHACGFTVAGELLCRGGGGAANNVPNAPPFTFSSLALETNRSCAVVRGNRTVVCWGGGRPAPSSPVVNGGFVAIVSGSNMTCGLLAFNYSVHCWGVDDAVFVTAPARFVPGPCVNVPCGGGDCQMYPDSASLCAGAGWICLPCQTPPPPSPRVLPPALPPALPPSPPPVSGSPPSPTSGSSRMNLGLLAFAIVGSIGAVSGMCSIAYCVWAGVCRRKKVHNSVQPTITNNNSTSGVVSLPRTFSGTPFGSRSSTIRRQGSRALSMMRRQRSGTSHADRAEEFTLAELAEATAGFSPENRIGAGSFGTVYRGKLADGREVAIKRGETGPRAKKFQEKESAFQSELAFLSRLHHKHLVGLVGFCEENDERLLVYEYMKHGALYDHLHANKNNLEGKNSEINLLNSWKMRIKIALDAARGIEYLHYYAVPPIIHRDIKSSNILLDAHWTARVSDFGLSLMGPESENGHLSMKAAGTVGYMDPEYYGLHHLTAKSDVYGLGVVLLELLTGRRAIFKEGDAAPVSVVDYSVPKIVGGDLAGVLDPRVGPPVVSMSEAVELVAYTAVHCVRAEGKDRPTMSDIVANLENALALFEDSHGSISSGSITLASD